MKKVLYLCICLCLLACSQPSQKTVRQEGLERLWALQECGMMFGHQDDPCYGLSWQWDADSSDVRATCGDLPAVMGFDLGGIELNADCNLDSVPFARIRQELLAHVARGGIVTLSWHPRNPLTGGSAWDVSDSTVVHSILPGGTGHQKFRAWMQRLSSFLLSLRDERGRLVPVIFRPWHENNGSWFWWGRALCSEEEYRGLWNLLQDQLLADGLDNLIWSYSPNVGLADEADFLSRYPGDERVDVIGLDAYQQPNGEAAFVQQLTTDLRLLCTYGQLSHRLVALTECGYQNLPDSTWWTRVLWPHIQPFPLSYFLTWRNANAAHYFAPAPGTASAEDFCHMVADEHVLLLRDIQPSSAHEP